MLFVLLGFICMCRAQDVKVYADGNELKDTVIHKSPLESLRLTCSVNQNKNTTSVQNAENFRVEWVQPPKAVPSHNHIQVNNLHNQAVLNIISLQHNDSGYYECHLCDYNISRRVRLDVRKSTIFCSDKMFVCASVGNCIASRYVCDGKNDCKNAEDENYEQCGADPCLGKIRDCSDGRCIPTNWCCDPDRDENCTVKQRPECCKPTSVKLYPGTTKQMDQYYLYKSNSMKALLLCIFGAALFFVVVSSCLFLVCRVHFYSCTINSMSSPNHSSSFREDSSGYNSRCPRRQQRRYPNGLNDSLRDIYCYWSPRNHAPIIDAGGQQSMLLLSNRFGEHALTSSEFNLFAYQTRPPSYSEIFQSDPPPPYVSTQNLNKISSNNAESNNLEDANLSKSLPDYCETEAGSSNQSSTNVITPSSVSNEPPGSIVNDNALINDNFISMTNDP